MNGYHMSLLMGKISTWILSDKVYHRITQNYGRSQKYDAEFCAAEKKARKEKLNIWGDPELTRKYLRLKSKWGQHGK